MNSPTNPFNPGRPIEAKEQNRNIAAYFGIDIFIPPKPYPSWTLSENWVWEAPIEYPDDGEQYIWNENAYQGDNTQGWELVNYE